MSNEIKNLGRESNTITIATFYENHLLGKYNYDPSCQRKSVWDEERESFLIDSIMKNFSIPAIFLYQKIDDETGKTIYDVIDGKQRLTSIIKFIKNEISLPDDYSNDAFGNEQLNGMKFEDLKGELAVYKKNFWRYSIPVEIIDTEEADIVDTVFDRLNRNGIPLSPQELRNAQFNKTKLLALINKLSELDFWKDRFTKTDRMEDIEFISELVLVILENKIFNATPKDIDLLYSIYQDIEDADAHTVNAEFQEVTRLMEALELDYKKFNLGISHIYAVWCACLFCYRGKTDIVKHKEGIKNLFIQFRNKDKSNDNKAIREYRSSMNGSSKGKGQRIKRIQAILDYCEIGIKVV